MASNMQRWKKIVDSLSIFLEIIVKLFEEIEETEAEERSKSCMQHLLVSRNYP